MDITIGVQPASVLKSMDKIKHSYQAVVALLVNP